MTEKDYPRDMTGYGQHPTVANWPNKARIAVQFVINYEEGGENNVLHGDRASETFLSEIIGANAYEARHMSMESLYEYGSRAGFWRLHRAFTSRQIPVTVFGVGMALERNPEAVAAMLQADWEIACHGYRWIDYQFVDIDVERTHMQQAIEVHERVTGNKPLGWYTGRDSPNTRDLVIENGGFLYDSDSYADDLPYWHHPAQKDQLTEHSKPHLIVPYTLDVNDMRFAAPQGFNAGDQFLNYLTDAFDVLYDEGATTPKMLSVGLHCRVIGKPGRMQSLLKFLDYIQTKQDVWLCRRSDIAQHWRDHHGI